MTSNQTHYAISLHARQPFGQTSKFFEKLPFDWSLIMHKSLQTVGQIKDQTQHSFGYRALIMGLSTWHGYELV